MVITKEAAKQLLEACKVAHDAINPPAYSTMYEWNGRLRKATKVLEDAIAEAENDV